MKLVPEKQSGERMKRVGELRLIESVVVITRLGEGFWEKPKTA